MFYPIKLLNLDLMGIEPTSTECKSAIFPVKLQAKLQDGRVELPTTRCKRAALPIKLI